MHFEENFPAMNWSADDFRKINFDGGWSIYVHFYFVFKKVFELEYVLLPTLSTDK